MEKDSVSGGILKRIIQATLALKRKTRSLKARLIIYSLLSPNKFLISSISNKLQAFSDKPDPDPDSDNQTTGIVLRCDSLRTQNSDVHDDDWKQVVEEEEVSGGECGGGGGGSVIEMVKHSKEEAGEEFCLEKDIDQVADLFIRNFHRQMMMQKQNSLKRYQQMLDG